MAKRRINSANIKVDFSQGYVSARDSNDLNPGELVSGVGAYYKPGDAMRIWKEPGRELFNTFGDGTLPIKGLAMCIFDLTSSGTSTESQQDKLVAYYDNQLSWVQPTDSGINGVIATSVTRSGLLEDDPDRLYSVHYDDSWYLSTAAGRPYVLDASQDILTRRMGMLPSDEKPTATEAGAASTPLIASGVDSPYFRHQQIAFGDTYCLGRGGTPSNLYFTSGEIVEADFGSSFYPWVGTFSNTENITDGNRDTTYAYGVIDPNGVKARTIRLKDFPASTGTGRYLKVKYLIGKSGGGDPAGGDIGVGTSLGDRGVLVRWGIEFISGVYIPPRYLDSLHTPAGQAEGTCGGLIEEIVDLYSASGVRIDDLWAESFSAPREKNIPIPDGIEISGNLKITIDFMSGGNGTLANFDYDAASYISGVNMGVPYGLFDTTVMRIYDGRVVDGTSVINNSSNTGGVSGVRYAITEYDSNNRKESVPGQQSDTLVFTDRLGALITLPSFQSNPNTDTYNIYRSNLPAGDPGVGVQDAWANFGLVSSQKIVSGLTNNYLDDYTIPITYTPSPLVPSIAVTADDVSTVYYLRDYAPPTMRAMTVFKGSVVGLSADSKRQLVYSYAGYPESFPQFHVIDKFPLPERDELVGVIPVGNTLMILAKGAVLTIQELPHVRLGRLVASEVDVIEGAPGCVSDYGYTSVEIDGFPSLAYVSIHGIYVTDGHSAKRISEDLDWDLEITRSTLKNSNLFFDKDLKHLIFSYDKSGDGVIDNKFIFHMDRIHRKANGLPKVLGPTPANLSRFVQGQIDNEYQIYTGSSASDGKVFKERTGTIDASSSYLTGTQLVPFDIKTGRYYGDWQFWSAIRGNLRHTNWSDSQLANILWTAGRDDGDNSDTVTRSVALTGKKGTELYLGRAGEFHQAEIKADNTSYYLMPTSNGLATALSDDSNEDTGAVDPTNMYDILTYGEPDVTTVGSLTGKNSASDANATVTVSGWGDTPLNNNAEFVFTYDYSVTSNGGCDIYADYSAGGAWIELVNQSATSTETGKTTIRAALPDGISSSGVIFRASANPTITLGDTGVLNIYSVGIHNPPANTGGISHLNVKVMPHGSAGDV
jgi:hypothetical protein